MFNQSPFLCSGQTNVSFEDLVPYIFVNLNYFPYLSFAIYLTVPKVPMMSTTNGTN